MQSDRQDSPDEAPDAALLEGAWSGLDAQLARERGLTGWLRRLPFGARASLAAGGCLLMVIVALLAMPRADLSELSLTRELGMLAALLVLLGGAARLAARPLDATPLSLGALGAIGVGTIAIAILEATTPTLHDPDPPSLAALLMSAVMCSMMGIALSVPAFVLARAVSREAPGASVGAAVVAALTALAALDVTCGLDSVRHMLLGHALPASVMVLAALGWQLRPAARAA